MIQCGRQTEQIEKALPRRRVVVDFRFLFAYGGPVADTLSSAPGAAFGAVREIVPPEILAPPMPHERRALVRDECAVVLDGFLRRLGHQEALCRRTLGLIAARFLTRHSHHRLGFARLADYARERLGISARELQSLGQAAAAMERLPKIAAAFESGELSWAKLRLLAAAATPGTEDDWLSLARGKTVRALESSCKDGRAAAKPRGQTDPLEPDEDETIDGEPRARFRMTCPRRVRSSWHGALELARRMAGEELSVWRAAEAIAAEGLSASEALTGRGSSERGSCDAFGDEVGSAPRPEAIVTSAGGDESEPLAGLDWAAVAQSIPEAVESLARDLDGTDAFVLDERMRAVVRSMQRIDWQLGRLLRLFFDMRLHEKVGFTSAASYVRERLGISARKGRALVRLERRSARAPQLASAYRNGEVSWVRALTLLPVLAEAHASAWVERAKSVTVRRLSDEVEWAAEIREAGAALGSVAPPPCGAVLMRPERQTCARDRDTPLDHEVTFVGPASVVALLRAAISAFSTPSEAPWRGLERLLDHTTAEWAGRPRHRDPIFERDGWRCAVPACSSRRNLHDHHVLFRSRGGHNGRENRVAVCAWHHLRGLHAGIVRARGRGPAAIVWEIGSRRGRPALLHLCGESYASAPGHAGP